MPARNQSIRMQLRLRQLTRIPRRERQPHLGDAIETSKTAWEYTDDFVRCPVNLDRPSDNAALGTVAAHPQPMTEHHQRRRACTLCFIVRERPPDDGCDAEHREVAIGDQLALHCVPDPRRGQS